MNRFAHLLDRLAFEPSRNAKLRLLADYFRTAQDPDRGYALAAMTGALSFTHAKPAMVRALVAERLDPVLFGMSYDYVGDLSETVALLWPAPEPSAERPNRPRGPTLSRVVEGLATTGKLALPRQVATWLDELDETGRWALLKLITGSLRIGVSARLAKTALAMLADIDANDIEEVWHGLSPPYIDLFAWLEGREPKPEGGNPAPFRTPMLAHAIEEADFSTLEPAAVSAEWKWDGIRVQAVAGPDGAGQMVHRLWSRSGEDITAGFPDLVGALAEPAFGAAALDGELLVMREGRVQPVAVLQQRLNRKTVSAKLLAEYPVHIRAYDLLAEGGEDLRALPFMERRARLEAFVARLEAGRVDLSPMVPFASWDDLAAARADPGAAGAGEDAEAVEGVMRKRRDSI